MMGVVLREADGKVMVDKLTPHGMAGKSGVKAGDMILTLDGRPIPSIEELKIILFFKKKGETVTVGLKRKHKLWPASELEVVVVL
jgi:S1-C subfamily serine protease